MQVAKSGCFLRHVHDFPIPSRQWWVSHELTFLEASCVLRLGVGAGC